MCIIQDQAVAYNQAYLIIARVRYIRTHIIFQNNIDSKYFPIISMMTFPVFFTTLYLVIWIGHKVKAVAMHTDLANIDQHYMSDSRCGFWVAQVTDRGWTDPSTVASIPLDASARVYEQTLVGTVAVAIKEDTPNEPPESVAWLRRMSVSKSFQRLGIGTTLADVALEHCARANFRAVELLTTEHHHQGRSLYVSKGFELMETQSKQYLGGLIHFALLRFRLPCTLMRSSLNA